MKTIKWIILIFFFVFAQNMPAAGQENQKNSDVHPAVDQMPEYPGGEDALKQFIAEKTNYPEEAQKAGIEGKVYVTFIVDEQGNVADTKIARGVDPALDKEALRVVSELSTWKPGKYEDKAVKVSYTLPVSFKLGEEERKD